MNNWRPLEKIPLDWHHKTLRTAVPYCVLFPGRLERRRKEEIIHRVFSHSGGLVSHPHLRRLFVPTWKFSTIKTPSELLQTPKCVCQRRLKRMLGAQKATEDSKEPDLPKGRGQMSGWPKQNPNRGAILSSPEMPDSSPIWLRGRHERTPSSVVALLLHWHSKHRLAQLLEPRVKWN